jgi:ATP-dependent helicase/nuclease subunit A
MSARAAIPIDQANRVAIRTELDRTLFVEAGAGTGKTTELVARVLALVESGVEMRRIAAITFTEAAAAELRSRLREALDRAAAEGSALAEAAVRQVDEAAISTLHSFAQRVIAEHSLEAGLPPVFEVRDEIQSGLAFADWWAETLDQLLDEPSLQSSWFAFVAIGLKANRMEVLAKQLHEHWDRLEDRPGGPPFPDPPGPDADDELARLVAEAARLMAEAGAMSVICDDQSDPSCQLIARLGQIAARTKGRDTVTILASFGSLYAGSGLKKGTRKPKLWNGQWAEVQEARDRALEAIDEARLFACDMATRRLIAAVRVKVLEAADQRRRTGELEFHDLLVLARRLLFDNPEVRSRMRDRWQRILIDEFQDTDPIQVEIAALLATEDAHVIADELPQLDEGRLFFVGDARQSIYRFRRADVRLFERVANSMLESVKPLVQNFRSVPGVLQWVNAVIGPMIGEGKYTPLQAGRKPLPSMKTPPVRVLGGPSAANLPAIREQEAEEIARVIKAVAGYGGVHAPWQVAADKAGTTTRNARYDDIAILLPTRATLDYLERALGDHKIPYRVESASLVWSTQEVRDLISCLRAIDDNGDQVAVVAALRSLVIGCSDEDLLEWAQAGGAWRVDAKQPETIPDDHPVRLGLARLHELAEVKFWAGVSGLVERAARELGFFELALANSRSRDSWRRLRHVVDEVRAFERAGGATLRQFLVWAAAQEDEGARIKEAVLPEPDHPAVRILTVHGAKGLEFPVCILSGLNAKRPNAALGRLLWDGMCVEARFNKSQLTSGFQSLDEIENREQADEGVRLLYVAATRARDHLVVSLHHKDEPRAQEYQRCHADRIWRASRQLEGELWTFMPDELPLSVTAVDPVAPTDDLAAERRAWAKERQDLIARVRRSPVRSATDMKKATDEAVERQPWQRGRGATAVGRAVHATLQTVDLATGERLKETASAQAAAEGVPHRAAEIEARVRAALSSSVAAEASKHRHWRELYVGAPVDDLTIEGYIDLLYETEEGLVLVDWKTDAIDPHNEQAEAISRYGGQMEAYAKVLAVTLGRPVVRAELVFLSEKEAIPVTVEMATAP